MLKNHRYWIFDLDGTLTLPQHDFDALRQQLGLPTGQPILEAIARLPIDQASSTTQRLDELELEIAAQAQAQPGAAELLDYLLQQHYRIGIVTRNSHLNARTTLQACALSDFFQDADIISRDCARPKPDPDGIQRLLQRWQAPAEQSVMIGDYLFDLQSGQRAGSKTVYFDPQQQGLWQQHADFTIRHLDELRRLL